MAQWTFGKICGGSGSKLFHAWPDWFTLHKTRHGGGLRLWSTSCFSYALQHWVETSLHLWVKIVLANTYFLSIKAKCSMKWLKHGQSKHNIVKLTMLQPDIKSSKSNIIIWSLLAYTQTHMFLYVGFSRYQFLNYIPNGSPFLLEWIMLR